MGPIKLWLENLLGGFYAGVTARTTRLGLPVINRDAACHFSVAYWMYMKLQQTKNLWLVTLCYLAAHTVDYSIHNNFNEWLNQTSCFYWIHCYKIEFYLQIGHKRTFEQIFGWCYSDISFSILLLWLLLIFTLLFTPLNLSQQQRLCAPDSGVLGSDLSVFWNSSHLQLSRHAGEEVL